MKKNVGTIDRWIRIAVAVVLAVIAFVTGLWWLYIIAFIALATGVAGYCLPYTLLGISTQKKKH